MKYLLLLLLVGCSTINPIATVSEHYVVTGVEAPQYKQCKAYTITAYHVQDSTLSIDVKCDWKSEPRFKIDIPSTGAYLFVQAFDGISGGIPVATSWTKLEYTEAWLTNERYLQLNELNPY